MWAKEQGLELEKLKRQDVDINDNDNTQKDGGDSSPDLASAMERALCLLQGYSKVCYISM